MPRGDRTGPMGMGPMTGRAAGYCAGFPGPGYVDAGPGWGYGRGWGRGFGRGFGRGLGRGFGRSVGWGFGGPWGAWQISREEELEYLKEQSDMLKQELASIDGRISQIEREQPAGGAEEA